MRERVRPNVHEIAEALKSFRRARGWTQTELATACGCTQSQVSRWEKDLDRPNVQALLAVAKLVPEQERDWWELAALPAGSQPARSAADADLRPIPLLRDSAAAGTPREIDEAEVEATISFPRRWLRSGGSLYAVKVEGDSMDPVLLDGHVVIIDTSSKDPKKLVNKMVAARDNGVTVKWLRYQDGTYLLVPQHVSGRHPIRLVNATSGVTIVGEVVKWIGEPPPARK